LIKVVIEHNSPPTFKMWKAKAKPTITLESLITYPSSTTATVVERLAFLAADCAEVFERTISDGTNQHKIHIELTSVDGGEEVSDPDEINEDFARLAIV